MRTQNRLLLSWSTLFALEASQTFQQMRKADDFCCDWLIRVNLPVPLGLLLGLVIAVMKVENYATVVPTKSDSDIYFVYNY